MLPLPSVSNALPSWEILSHATAWINLETSSEISHKKTSTVKFHLYAVLKEVKSEGQTMVAGRDWRKAEWKGLSSRCSFILISMRKVLKMGTGDTWLHNTVNNATEVDFNEAHFAW